MARPFFTVKASGLIHLVVQAIVQPLDQRGRGTSSGRTGGI
jgi:hypothetical protein